MKILKNEGKFKVLSKPEDVVNSIADAARTCYQSYDKSSLENNIKLVKNLMTRGHFAMYEFADLIVRFDNVSRGFCYDDQTEVLTNRGWKLFKDILDDDTFATLNTNTMEVEYQSKLDSTIEEWDGEMIYGKSTMVDFAVTPNHRMYYYHYDSRINRSWKIDKAEKIYNKRVKFLRSFPNWSGDKINIELDGFDVNSLAFAKLLGLYVTDGSKYKGKTNDGRIFLYQIKQTGKEYIETVLSELGIKINYNGSAYIINNTKLYNFFNENFKSDLTKTYCGKLPNWLLNSNKEYLEAFIEAVILGDGNIHKENNHRVIYSSNKDYVDGFQEIIAKIGKSSIIRIDDRVGQKRLVGDNIIENKVIGYVVSITDRTNEHLFNKKHWSKKHYKGYVYCVTVPNGTLYVRRNGKPFWSGNTHEMVRHRLASYAQESTRYVDEKDFEFVVPPYRDEDEGSIDLSFYLKDEDSKELSFRNILRFIGTAYRSLRNKGWKPEDARQILPTALVAQIVVKASIREWRHIFTMRCDKFAHWEIRAVMLNLLKWCKENIPVVFDDFQFFTTADGVEYARPVMSAFNIAERIAEYSEHYDMDTLVNKLDSVVSLKLYEALNKKHFK